MLGASKPRLLIPNSVVKLRGKSKLDAILDWCLTYSDCWVGPHLSGAMSTLELVGATESDIERLAEIWLYARFPRFRL